MHCLLSNQPLAAGLRVRLGDASWRLKKSFETADKLARRIFLVDEDEVASGSYTVKDFATGEQGKVGRGTLVSAFGGENSGS